LISSFCLWQTDDCQLSVEQVWSSWDWIERTIFFALVLMLGYTVFALLRFLRRYYPALRAPRGLVGKTSEQDYRMLVADLNRGLESLKAIPLVAPFLGLAGTSYGILAAFSFGWIGPPYGFVAFIIRRIAETLVTAGLGILVAIPALICHNFARTRIDALAHSSTRRASPTLANFESIQFAQTLPLKRRFSTLPTFALIAAPTLAAVVGMYMAFSLYPTSKGLPVGLARCESYDRRIVLNLTNGGKMSINDEPVDRADLATRLSVFYRQVEDRTLYFYAEDEVPFQSAADAIDLAENAPIPGASPPTISVLLVTPDAPCFVPVKIIPIRPAHRR